MTRPNLAIIVAIMINIVAVAAQTPPARTSWPIREAPAEWRSTISRADVLIVSMQDSLLWQLHNKLAQGGPALAFGSCHVDTTYLAYRIARAEGIAAGMTSGRLRDPTNKPKGWAADIVAAHTGRKAHDVKGFAVDLGDRIGVLRPMVQTKTCASCHGTLDELSPSVRRLIAERYPNDRATGFVEGEIRGWFWVEMPKPTRASRDVRVP
jgi:hypothetical protein